jgi:hypothetical protein
MLLNPQPERDCDDITYADAPGVTCLETVSEGPNKSNLVRLSDEVRFEAPKLAQEVVCSYWRKVNLLRESYGTLSLVSLVDLDLMSMAVCFCLQDPKPHRTFAFNEILDALEYDLQTHKQTSGPSAFPSQGTDGDDVSGTHTFKIVTTEDAFALRTRRR